jgi:CRISPR-associated protein Cas1
VVEPKDGDTAKIPLADISAIILENPQISITASTLAICANSSIALFVCDSTHTPNGILTPLGTHSRHTKTTRAQLEWSEPFKKRCWQKIIKAKIKNQAKLLEKTDNLVAAKRLANIASKVTSGDNTNCEAQAAAVYFKNLFKNFSRNLNCVQNSALNYGYTILRGAVARSVAASGFVPAVGLFHNSELNSFNLADDILEPFRPFVDETVLNMFGAKTQETDLTKESRAELIALLGESCYIGAQHETILNAVYLVAKSLMSCSFEKNSDTILLPEFAKL